MPKYWIGVASREHVKNGIKEGIAQVCHGKGGPLKRINPGDWLIYYSPVEIFGEKTPCRKFTALGKIKDTDAYQFRVSDDFVPWRRDVAFCSGKDAEVEPLITQLNFIKNKNNWGFPFRRGCFEISRKDFHLIAKKMGVHTDE